MLRIFSIAALLAAARVPAALGTGAEKERKWLPHGEYILDLEVFELSPGVTCFGARVNKLAVKEGGHMRTVWEAGAKNNPALAHINVNDATELHAWSGSGCVFSYRLQDGCSYAEALFEPAISLCFLAAGQSSSGKQEPAEPGSERAPRQRRWTSGRFLACAGLAAAASVAGFVFLLWGRACCRRKAGAETAMDGGDGGGGGDRASSVSICLTAD